MTFFTRWFQTGRTRSGIKKSQIPTPGSSTSGSGGLVSGWTWWSTTGCRQRTESWFTVTPTTATSSGARWWRKPTPSEQCVCVCVCVCVCSQISFITTNCEDVESVLHGLKFEAQESISQIADFSQIPKFQELINHNVCLRANACLFLGCADAMRRWMGATRPTLS